MRELSPRAVIYSTTTAALLGPVPGAIRFDAPAAGNRPGRHGIWQRPVEARRFKAAPLLVPWSEGGLAEAPAPHADAVVVPMPVAPSGAGGERDIAAITYGANPEKKGLDRVLAAWLIESRAGEELVVAGLDERAGAELAAATRRGTPRGAGPARGRRGASAGRALRRDVSRDEYRALLRRARVFLTAPRREDYGIAQLEALADGCVLVTTPRPGPYAALPIARRARHRGSSGHGSRSGPRSTTRSPATPSAPPRRSSRSRAPPSIASSPSGCSRGSSRLARLRSGAKSSHERVLATCSGVSQARRAVAIP